MIPAPLATPRRSDEDRARRSNTKAAALLLLAIAGLSVRCAHVPAEAARMPAPAIPDPQVREFVRLVNQHRRRIGCRALAWDRRIAAVASRHSRDMEVRGFFDHVNPDGVSPFRRLRAAGVGYRAAAENIAQDGAPPEVVLRRWLASPGHRRNLENCSYTVHGLGRHGEYWTHVFARP
jgi:uncharacterized protein YkwD